MSSLGIDLGGTYVRAVVCSGARWRLVDRRVTPRNPSELLNIFCGWAARLDEMLTVGVAVAPQVGANGRIASWPTRPEYGGFDLVGSLRAAFGKAPDLLDDCAAGAVAEHVRVTFAEAVPGTSTLYVGVGTGLGAGVVVADALHVGARRGAMALGHVRVASSASIACPCGKIGCLQATVSGQALERRAAEAGMRAHEVTTLAADGDSLALEMVGDLTAALAEGISVSARLLDPHRVVVGGGLVDAGVVSLETLGLRLGFPVRNAAYGAFSSAVGAAMWGRVGHRRSLFRAWRLEASTAPPPPLSRPARASRERSA